MTSAVSNLLASIRGGAKEEVGVASLAQLHRDLLIAGVAVAAATQVGGAWERGWGGAGGGVGWGWGRGWEGGEWSGASLHSSLITKPDCILKPLEKWEI